MTKEAKELTLQDAYVEHMKDIYSAETQIIKALPKIIQTVTASELKKALEKHLKETEGQVARLDQIFKMLDASPRGKKCLGMEGVLAEGKEAMAENFASPDLMDSVLIGGCQKVEHYEICNYKDAIHMAELLGHDAAIEPLTKSLLEEEAADQKLAELGETILTSETVEAAQAV